MFLGEVMANRSRNVEDVARDMGTEAERVRRWLSGVELPDWQFMPQIRSNVFWADEEDVAIWAKFLSVWRTASEESPQSVIC